MRDIIDRVGGGEIGEIEVFVPVSRSPPVQMARRAEPRNQRPASGGSHSAAGEGKYRALFGEGANLLAHAPREDVLTDTSNSNEPHLANGSAWYYATAWSWGFAREGDPINRQSCDNLEQPHPEERLCWHTSSNDVDAGYRCGVKIVEGDPMWERVILQSG